MGFRSMLIPLALLPLSGCSMLIMEAAPPKDEWTSGKRVNCSSGNGWAILDTLGSIAIVASSSAALSVAAPSVESDTIIPLGVVAGASALVYAVSAGMGFSTASTCKAYLETASAADSERLLKVAALPSGCTKDTDCKGDRICTNGVCAPPGGTPVDPPKLSGVITGQWKMDTTSARSVAFAELPRFVSGRIKCERKDGVSIEGVLTRVGSMTLFVKTAGGHMAVVGGDLVTCSARREG